MAELGLAADVATIARHYGDLLDALVVDVADRALAGAMPVPADVANTLMQSTDDKICLARHCLGLCERLAARPGGPGKRNPAETGA
jgi:2-phospho-L-lactate transferase/gluconeogenesis factor (CofD/UPF0052 family)